LYLKHLALSEKIRIREDIKYIISVIINYSTIEYNHARSWYYHKLKKREKRFEYISNVINVYHDNSHFIAPLIEDYIATWNNILLASRKFEDVEIELNHYEEYKLLATKYKKIFATLPDAIIAFYELIGHLHEISFRMAFLRLYTHFRF